MNKNTLRNLATTLMLTIVFVTFTFITKFVDISSFYPIDQRTLLPVVEIVGKIGLSSLNIPFFKAIGFNSICYLLSEIFGYLLIVGIAFYFVLFIIQAIKNKSLLKVNKDLWVICIFSISLFAIDLIFRFVAINYRPILEIGKNSLESSYPSSHTLLAGSISGASIVFILRNIKNNKAKIILCAFCGVIAITTITLRLFSGVHWVSDIIGSILLSMTLVSSFIFVLFYKKKNVTL